MKRNLKLSVIAVMGTVLVACNKDDNKIKIQAHDQNQMMTIMHQMMDRMDQ